MILECLQVLGEHVLVACAALQAVLEQVCSAGLLGIILKRADVNRSDVL